MFVLNDKPTVFFDVDSTLVFTAQEYPGDLSTARKTWFGDRMFYIHHPHIECLLDFQARGHNIIVWSQGGSAWARAVVEQLDLCDVVTACLTKPNWVFDDKPVAEWLNDSHRSYMTP